MTEPQPSQAVVEPRAVIEVVARTAADLRRDAAAGERPDRVPDCVDRRTREPLRAAGSTESVEDLKSELDGLRTAMKSRAVIEQAKGMLMLRHRCNEDAAFLILIKSSQETQLKLRDVAQHLVEWESGVSAR